MGLEIANLTWGYMDLSDTWHPYSCNSAGGVGVRFAIKNTGTKTIKYIDFIFVPYNRVGDVVACEISRKVNYILQFTGPLAPGYWSGNKYKNNVWYNNSISQVKILRVLIQYMDGSEETVEGSDLTYSNTNANGGCYVATAVYGSYDCPQVWTLRRYRDYTLAETWYGRAFVKTYYAVSPTLVKWFGHTEWFKKMWKGKLDRMVADLNAKGVKDTPYEDKVW